MMAPVVRAGDDGRGTTGQAALLAALWLVPVQVLPSGGPQPSASTAWLLASSAPAIAAVSWILAIAAAWTAVVVRRADRGDRRARVALRTALPGAIAGTVPVLLVVGWLLLWSLDR